MPKSMYCGCCGQRVLYYRFHLEAGMCRYCYNRASITLEVTISARGVALAQRQHKGKSAIDAVKDTFKFCFGLYELQEVLAQGDDLYEIIALGRHKQSTYHLDAKVKEVQ